MKTTLHEKLDAELLTGVSCSFPSTPPFCASQAFNSYSEQVKMYNLVGSLSNAALTVQEELCTEYLTSHIPLLGLM